MWQADPNSEPLHRSSNSARGDRWVIGGESGTFDRYSIQIVWLSPRLLTPSIERFCVTARSFDYLKSTFEFITWTEFEKSVRNRKMTVDPGCWGQNVLPVTQLHLNGVINTLNDRQILIVGCCIIIQILSWEYWEKIDSKLIQNFKYLKWSVCHSNYHFHWFKDTVWQPDHFYRLKMKFTFDMMKFYQILIIIK